MNAGIHDTIGGTSAGFCSLSEVAGMGSCDIARTHNYKKTTDKEYNSSARQEKRFEGNIIFFSENSFQYKKRFHKGDCCGIVKASARNLVEDKARIVDGNIDNMVKWEHNGNTAYICSECGYIDESRSAVTPEEKKETTVLSIADQKLFHGRVIDPLSNEYEPTEEELAAAMEEFKL